mgnify:FL=1
MIEEVYIFATCRYSYLYNKNIQFIKKLREFHSNFYKIGNNINIYTQPVNHTTKLVDIYDDILYMRGELYENLDAANNKNLQSLFFRAHNSYINPNTHPLNKNNTIRFDKIIMEVFSIKQIIINTRKYGDEFFRKNLPWKISTNFQKNNEVFDENDFVVTTMGQKECFEILDKIRIMVGCDIMIIGPYISKKVPDFVNDERRETQAILHTYCSEKKLCYFDMSDAISKHDNLEKDEFHFNQEGNNMLSDVIYNFIRNKRSQKIN